MPTDKYEHRKVCVDVDSVLTILADISVLSRNFLHSFMTELQEIDTEGEPEYFGRVVDAVISAIYSELALRSGQPDFPH